MALSDFQREVCRLLAQSRLQSGQSYGAALSEMTRSTRLSRDVDIFHDTLEALDATWKIDRALLENNGFLLTPVRVLTGFVEAEIARGAGTNSEDRVLVQWARDSAWRFFPLQAHPDFGLTLHPFDLATNQILALVGRLEPRDWIDALEAHRHIAPLGLLAWAACGKDEGWNPQLIVEEANRNARLSRDEWQEFEWHGAPPDFTVLKTHWREAVAQAPHLIALLPPENVGQAVLHRNSGVFHGDFDALQRALQNDELQFHPGHIGGVWPVVKPLRNT